MDFGCNIGLKTLMMFDKVRFNLVDFLLTTFPKNRKGIYSYSN